MPRVRGVLLRSDRSLREDAHAALRAAGYHLQHTKFRTKKRDLRVPREAHLFHVHLRGFFWELVAVRDILRADRKSGKRVNCAYEAVNGSPWYAEVDDLRNLAHLTFHVVEAAYSSETGKLTAWMINPVRPNGRQVGLRELKEYLAEMRKAV
jgi:hypothetical protein